MSTPTLILGQLEDSAVALDLCSALRTVQERSRLPIKLEPTSHLDELLQLIRTHDGEKRLGVVLSPDGRRPIHFGPARFDSLVKLRAQRPDIPVLFVNRPSGLPPPLRVVNAGVREIVVGDEDAPSGAMLPLLLWQTVVAGDAAMGWFREDGWRRVRGPIMLAVSILIHRKVEFRCERLTPEDLAIACGCPVKELGSTFRRNALRFRPGLLPLLELFSLAIRVADRREPFATARSHMGFRSTEALARECRQWLEVDWDALRKPGAIDRALDRLYQTLQPGSRAAETSSTDRNMCPQHIVDAFREHGAQWRSVARQRAIEFGLPPDQVEDAEQEVMLRLVRHLKGNGPTAEVTREFVRTVTKNVCIDGWRARREWTLTEAELAARGPPMDSERRQWLRRAISTLPEPRRTVMRLRWLAGWPNAPVARLLGRSIGAVDKLRKRGTERLAEMRHGSRARCGARSPWARHR